MQKLFFDQRRKKENCGQQSKKATEETTLMFMLILDNKSTLGKAENNNVWLNVDFLFNKTLSLVHF